MVDSKLEFFIKKKLEYIIYLKASSHNFVENQQLNVILFRQALVQYHLLHTTSTAF